MDIYQFAMRMEKDGEEYYRRLAREKTVTPGVAIILTMLADEEVKHYAVVERLSRKETDPPPADSAILNRVKNIFVGMRAEKLSSAIDSTPATDNYRRACVIEEESVKFYREKAQQSESEHEQRIFSRLADEEANHLRVMETLVEFVSRPEPGNWLENAEWHHLEEY